MGKVAIVHDVGSNTAKERVGVDTGTYFGVFWEGNGSYPQVSSNCGGIGCLAQGSTCICPVTTETTGVFSTLPSADDLLSELHIGAVDPNLLGDDYKLCTAPSCEAQSYNIYTRTEVDTDAGLLSALDHQTTFEVTNPKTGAPLFLSNAKSTVHLGGGYTFRNPPMYNSPVDPTTRDALYETDDILQQYFQHPNTAPFISTKLISLFVTSNPSPRYVESVANAFTEGLYLSSDGTSFGSGVYGSLEATIAAIMLDREARASTLDDDANHGRAREPALKFMHIMRSMELSTSSGASREIDMIWLTERGIGQEVYKAPSGENAFITLQHYSFSIFLNRMYIQSCSFQSLASSWPSTSLLDL